MSGLPAPARAKLNTLAQAADDADALASAALAQVKAAETRLESTIHALNTTDSPSRVAELKRDAEAITAEVERLRGVQGERRARRDTAIQLVTRLRGWADRLPAHMAFAMAPVANEANEGGPRAAVERYRGKIKELRAEMDAVRKAPLTRAEVKKFVTAWITQRAARGRPHIVVDHDRADVLFENTRALVPGDRLNAPLSADTFVWLFRDEFAEAMEREVDALTLADPLSREDRAARLEQLRGELITAERAEEAAITRASEEGTFIVRRVDADPLAVLGIQVVGAASKAA